MKVYSKDEVMAILQAQVDNKAKSRYSDSVLVQMLENVDVESLSVEPTRGGFPFNRGSLAEAILKAFLNGWTMGFKTSRNADLKRAKGDDRATRRELGLNPNRNYEIKFSTSYALASDSEVKTKQVIKIIPSGIYLVDREEYDRANYPQGERLNELSELLGFQA